MNSTEPRIQFYDTDSGYICYVSEVFPGLDCRVHDAIRTIEDIHIDGKSALLFVLDDGGDVTPDQIRQNANAVFLEALSVSNRGVTFMDEIMKNSPLRDNEAWLNKPEGRSLFLSQREARLTAWRGRKRSGNARKATQNVGCHSPIVPDGQNRHSGGGKRKRK